MKAVVAGSTGLVGSHLLRMLIKNADYDRIWMLTRRPQYTDNPKVVIILTDFENLADSLKEIEADHVFCCLGTTMKKAGSKEAFRKVDLEYPFKLAEIMLAKKAQKFLLISALGANRNSIIFYNRVKGEVEEAIGGLGYTSLYIFRPSLLLGEREEARTGEDIAKKIYKYLDKFFIGPLKKYKSIHAEKVAASMIEMAKTDKNETKILESDQIMEHQPGKD
jgi:uncharacterized protein YbjT (DUF2867 family)